MYIYHVLLNSNLVNTQLDKYDAAVVWDRVSHLCETRICTNSCKIVTGTYLLNFSWVKTSNTMAQDTAENGLLTLTERGQDNQLKEEATRCKIDLMT